MRRSERDRVVERERVCERERERGKTERERRGRERGYRIFLRVSRALEAQVSSSRIIVSSSSRNYVKFKSANG